MKKPTTELIQGDTLQDVKTALTKLFSTWDCKEIVEVFINKLPIDNFYKFEALVIYTREL